MVRREQEGNDDDREAKDSEIRREKKGRKKDREKEKGKKEAKNNGIRGVKTIFF